MSLIKGLNKNVRELHISDNSLSELYYGSSLIWKKDSSGDFGESNLLSLDGLVLLSEDNLVLTSNE